MDKLKKYDIEVRVQTTYLDYESVPQQNHYVFAYTITIVNTGSITAQLLNRHWLITNADGKIYEVQGEGVIGEQPILVPGAAYQYTSGTVLDTPVGTMQGSYQMLADDGQVFDANIAPFTLAVPHKLH